MHTYGTSHKKKAIKLTVGVTSSTRGRGSRRATSRCEYSGKWVLWIPTKGQISMQKRHEKGQISALHQISQKLSELLFVVPQES